MKLYTIMCTPGYPLSGDGRAFTAKRPMAMGVNRIQRERLGRTAAVTHVQTVFTDAPGSTSALSFVRRP
jgi:hypothetical protein